VQELIDVKLTILLSLVNGQHCIIQAEQDDLEQLEQELQLVRTSTLTPTLVENVLTDCFQRLWSILYCDPLR
jgi:hypothetical protein